MMFVISEMSVLPSAYLKPQTMVERLKGCLKQQMLLQNHLKKKGISNERMS